MILDTCAVIMLAEGKEKDDIINFLSEQNVEPSISLITFAEFISCSYMNENEAFKAENYLNGNFKVLDIDVSVCREAARLRRRYNKKQKQQKANFRKGLADFIIVATASLRNEKVFTFDKRLLQMLPEYTITIE